MLEEPIIPGNKDVILPILEGFFDEAGRLNSEQTKKNIGNLFLIGLLGIHYEKARSESREGRLKIASEIIASLHIEGIKVLYQKEEGTYRDALHSS